MSARAFCAGLAVLLAATLAACAPQEPDGRTGPGEPTPTASSRNPSEPAETPEPSAGGASAAEASAGAATSAAPVPVEPGTGDGSAAPSPIEIPAEPTASLDPDGHLLKAWGESAELVDSTGAVRAAVTVHSVQVLPSCPGEFAGPPQHGAFLVVDVEATMAAGGGPGELLLLGPAVWSVRGVDGRGARGLESDAAWHCYETGERVTSTLAPGESVRGLLVLDSEVTDGRVAYQPTGGAGWSWPVGEGH